MSTIVKEPKKISSTYTTEDRGIIQISNSELPKNLVLKLYVLFFSKLLLVLGIKIHRAFTNYASEPILKST